MSASLPEVEASVEELGTAKRSRIPGVAAMRATSGFQRGMLIFGLLIVLLFVVLAVFASWIAPYDFDQTGKGTELFPTQAAPSAQHWFGTTVDGFDVQPPNMRVIEATGAGAFLLTNAHPELRNFFEPGKELETFANGDELIAKIRHYLAHEPERQAIARQGRARCLKERSIAVSATQFRAMVEQKLNAKA